MAKFTPYGLKALPTTGIDVNGLYFIKGDADTSFKIYIRKADNSDWVSLGTVDSVDSVNNLIGEVKIDLDFTDGKLKILATGSGTATQVTDRKSTRLNSSHVAISYAVFCLKKKHNT